MKFDSPLITNSPGNDNNLDRWINWAVAPPIRQSNTEKLPLPRTLTELLENDSPGKSIMLGEDRNIIIIQPPPRHPAYTYSAGNHAIGFGT